MSHIFDALQRSEAERTGLDVPGFSLATDLLHAPHPEAPEPVAAVEDELLRSPAAIAAAVLDGVEPSADQTSRESVPTPVPATAGPVDQFSQFQSLRMLVSPQSKLVSLTDKDSLASEKFRFLAVRLRQLQQNKQLKKILITSTIPEEGKSMVAANLACTLARRAPQKTLLVEGDLRRPALSKLFGIGRVPGLSEWLHGERGPITSIYRLEEAGFYILPAGDAPRNPLELMQSGRLPALLDQLTSWFDWIVIDSPPVLPLADTSVWMRLSDGILLVTRPGTTQKQQLQKGLDAIEKSKLIGALLNSSQEAVHDDYYQHYGARAVEKNTNGITS